MICFMCSSRNLQMSKDAKDTQTILKSNCESLFKKLCLSYSEKCPSEHNAMCPSEHEAGIKLELKENCSSHIRVLPSN